ncbi:MAG: HD domain-containing protein [bacterium]|nr:HD domain-containing protein [bacterium]
MHETNYHVSLHRPPEYNRRDVRTDSSRTSHRKLPVDVVNRPVFSPACPELKSPYKYENPPLEGGFFVNNQELNLNTFDEIRCMLMKLSNDEMMPILDSRVRDHVNRVTAISRRIAEAMGEEITQYTNLPQDISMVIVVIGALEHDNGKVAWTEDILDLFAKITPAQFQEFVIPHSELGAKVIESVAKVHGIADHWAVKEVIRIAREHHLKWNPEKCGRVGYPENCGQQSFFASVISVADSLDAMLFRPYSSKYLDLDSCYHEVLTCMESGEFNDQLRGAFIKWFLSEKDSLIDQCQRMRISNEREPSRKARAPFRQLEMAA